MTKLYTVWGVYYVWDWNLRLNSYISENLLRVNCWPELTKFMIWLLLFYAVDFWGVFVIKSFDCCRKFYDPLLTRWENCCHSRYSLKLLEWSIFFALLRSLGTIFWQKLDTPKFLSPGWVSSLTFVYIVMSWAVSFSISTCFLFASLLFNSAYYAF